MPRFIAFLRAINVGGHTVKMADLRVLFEALGHTHVETFIASGNVIFDTVETDPNVLEASIMQHLHASLGYAVETFLRTPAGLADVAQYAPFAAFPSAGGTLSIGFLRAAPSAESQQRMLALATPTDALHIHGRELYWHCLTRVSDSTLSGAHIERVLKQPTTVRNSTTVSKIAAKYPA